MQLLRILLMLPMVMIMSCASTSPPPLAGIERTVDLPRFMGDWYVIAFIPIDVPFLPMFSEKGAHNGIESYRLGQDGTIETTYTFRRDSFTGPETRFTPQARVANPPINSEWKMKFAWYLPSSDYLIIYLDDEYQTTIIGVPDRKYVWIMSRAPAIPDAEYQRLVSLLQARGYDIGKLEPVPQQWNGSARP